MKVLVKYGLSPAAGIDLLADSSIQPSGRPLFIPDWAGQMTGTLAVAVRIGRLGKCIAPRFATRYWDAVTGCVITRGTDIHGPLPGQQTPSRIHDGALLLGQMQPREVIDTPGAALCWTTDGQPIGQMPLLAVSQVVNATLSQLSQYMTLKMGDLLCLCSTVVQPLHIGSTTVVSLNGSPLLTTKIK